MHKTILTALLFLASAIINLVFAQTKPGYILTKVTNQDCSYFIHQLHIKIRPSSSTYTWEGDCKNGLLNGIGILKYYPDGKIMRVEKVELTNGYETKLLDSYHLEDGLSARNTRVKTLWRWETGKPASQVINNNSAPSWAAEVRDIAIASSNEYIAYLDKVQIEERQQQPQNILQNFAVKNGASGFVREAVFKNPYSFEGKVLLISWAILGQFTSKDCAYFEGFKQAPIMVCNLNAATYKDSDKNFMAVKIIGTDKFEMLGTKLTIPKAVWVDQMLCKEPRCREFDGLSFTPKN